MTERLPQDKIEIPRRSPIIKANLGGRAVDLTWYTTQIFIYRAPYSAMNHLRHQEEGEKTGIIAFNGGNEAPAMELLKRGFTVTYASEPTDLVLRQYAEMEQRGLETDLVGLLGGEGAE